MATFQLKGYRGAKMVVHDDEDQDRSVENEGSIQNLNSNSAIDVKYQRYPYCIVWTPIPLISWIFPMIGHVGICTSEGVIHDFAGSNFVSVDDFAFGDPHKYVQLERQSIEPHAWDSYIKKGDDRFSDETHNLFKNNGHNYVAWVLNAMKYDGKTNWNPVNVWKLTISKSKYVSPKYILRTYIGFILLVLTLLILTRK